LRSKKPLKVNKKSFQNLLQPHFHRHFPAITHHQFFLHFTEPEKTPQFSSFSQAVTRSHPHPFHNLLNSSLKPRLHNTLTPPTEKKAFHHLSISLFHCFMFDNKKQQREQNIFRRFGALVRELRVACVGYGGRNSSEAKRASSSTDRSVLNKKKMRGRKKNSLDVSV
jgi:hypothetical protein